MIKVVSLTFGWVAVKWVAVRMGDSSGR